MSQGEYYLEMSGQLGKQYPKTRVFPDLRRLNPGSGFFFGEKPPLAKTKLKENSQIGPPVMEEIGGKHTYTQTSCCYIYTGTDTI